MLQSLTRHDTFEQYNNAEPGIGKTAVGTQAITKDSILRCVVENKDVLASLGVRSIGLFGSFVRGQQQPDSDVDLLVEFTDDKHTFDNFMDIAFLLEELLGRKIDLLTPEALNPHIGPHILREVERVAIAA